MAVPHRRLEELIEIGGLSDAQLDSARMADGARALYGLAEWDFVRQVPRPHLRFLASLTPLQRRQVAAEPGLAFDQMTLPQQQSFLKLALGGSTDLAKPTPEELTVISVRASLTPANGFRWNPPFKGPPNPNAIGPPPVFGPTRESTLAAARRIDPSVTDAQILPGPMELHVRYALGNPGAPKGSEYTLQATMSRGDVARP
jgi:hypothetical protein